MRFKDITVPDIYTDSWDFRFFLKWIWECLTKVKYDTENIIDNYDPLKCKEELLWMLGDTEGFKYDNRLSAAFNRLVILYFMDMIRKKGSKAGVTFAAEVNLAQFNLISYAAGYEDEDGNIVDGKEILENRLEDTSVPVNAVSVTPHTSEGFIDVVYFSTEKPIDACIEYVRPLGMYLFQHAGVRFDARTKISVDARLTNTSEYWESISSTRLGQYTRDDYARMQRVDGVLDNKIDNSLNVLTSDARDKVWYRNSKYEVEKNTRINPGYRALYSLQLSNNEHIVKALIDPMFSLGYGPQRTSTTYSDEHYYITEDDVTVINPKSYMYHSSSTGYKDHPRYTRYSYTDPESPDFIPDDSYKSAPQYNLRYDRNYDLSITEDITVLDEDNNPGTRLRPIPAVNPVMNKAISSVGDAIAVDDVKFSDVTDEGIVAKYLGSDEDE